MSAVIYGKHPAYGDFLAHGLPHEQMQFFDKWLEGVLPPLKAGLGDQWEASWRAAPVLRFWMGPDIFGAPLTGLFIASRDKVGRRYPLIFGLTGVVAPPPVHPAHDEAPFDVLLAHLGAFEAPQVGAKGVGQLMDGLSLPELKGAPFEEGQDGVLWAQRKDGNLRQLLSDARGADGDKAQLGRSHWWHGEEIYRHAGWLAVNGLPDVGALTWLLTDRVKPPEAVPKDAAPAADAEVVAPEQTPQPAPDAQQGETHE
ncbi:MAG: type VI secretion system-associated protein TagF [Pseudomonadota bacterium]